jgi:hypothetical protein
MKRVKLDAAFTMIGRGDMKRGIAAVVTAAVLWTVLWLGFTSLARTLFPGTIDPLQPLTHSGALLSYLAWSVLINALCGYVCAWIRRDDPMKTVWVFAFIQLALGIGFEASYWHMTPVWYHLVFLALLVPTTVIGGRAAANRLSAQKPVTAPA